MNVGERIKLRRHQLGLSQNDLAALMNTSQQQIWRYEKGENKPTTDVIAALATALETTADYLIGLSDEIKPVGDESDLSTNERLLVNLYRGKPPEKQQTVLDVVKAI